VDWVGAGNRLGMPVGVPGRDWLETGSEAIIYFFRRMRGVMHTHIESGTNVQTQTETLGPSVRCVGMPNERDRESVWQLWLLAVVGHCQ
jgi:hypothetical protein